MRSDADVVVIGGGVIGTAVAYYLSRDGYRVTLLEMRELASGASGANLGSIAVHSMGPQLLPMGVQSARIYSSLSLELEWDLGYERRDAMVIIQTEAEEEWNYVRSLAVSLRESGLSAEFLSGEETRRVEPTLSSAVLGATYCGNHAQLNPQRLTLGYAHGARRLGAEILARTPATGIEVQGGRVLGVRTPQGGIQAPWLVNAAGVGAPALGRMVGVEHAVIARRGQVLVTERRPNLPHTKISTASGIPSKNHDGLALGNDLGLRLSLSPTSTGNVMLGGTKEATGEDIGTTPTAASAISGAAGRIVPALYMSRVVRTWAGVRPMTPDGMPLLGAVDGPQGYLVATGHCHHGVGLAAITGLYLAKVVASGGKGPSIPQFLATL